MYFLDVRLLTKVFLLAEPYIYELTDDYPNYS